MSSHAPSVGWQHGAEGFIAECSARCDQPPSPFKVRKADKGGRHYAPGEIGPDEHDLASGTRLEHSVRDELAILVHERRRLHIAEITVFADIDMEVALAVADQHHLVADQILELTFGHPA